jgi:DNA polymerase III alpha subunit
MNQNSFYSSLTFNRLLLFLNSAQMCTIDTMEKQTDDFLSYQVPEQWRQGSIRSLYPPIPAKTAGVDFDIYDFNMLFNDEPTKELIRTGKTIGCFYIESPGMRALLRKLNVETFEMLTAASSIIRPGVAESGMMQEFIARHKDPSRRKYLVPEMEEHLAETYGVMIYQEDVIKIAHHIAGLSLEEADLLRRAMSGKMRSYKAMEAITEKFFSSCRTRNLTDAQSKELWRQIESFAGYSFCKAHSASFALLSFQVAYLKTHYPAEFLSSVLSNMGGFYSAAVYIQEAVRLGISVKLPCINRSQYEYTGSAMEIRIGLMAVKNLSRNTIEKIISERENGRYVSLADFLIRTGTGIEQAALLIKCGTMDCFKMPRPYLLRLLDIYIKKRRILDESYNDLFMGEIFSLEKEIKTSKNFSIEEICRYEYEAFDYMVTRHPLYFFREHTEHYSVTKASQMESLTGRRVKMIGWYMASKRIKTKKGTIMKFLSLEDLTGTFEAVIFPRVYEQYAEKTMSMGPYLLEGKIDPADSNNLVVDRLQILSSLNIKSALQKDSVENNYFGDKEKISEEEFSIVQNLGKDKLLRAYAG